MIKAVKMNAVITYLPILKNVKEPNSNLRQMSTLILLLTHGVTVFKKYAICATILFQIHIEWMSSIQVPVALKSEVQRKEICINSFDFV